LKKNNLGTKEAGEAIGEMLKGNSVLKELDLSENSVYKHNGGDALGFAKAVSKGLLDNRALTSLDISGNNLTNYGKDTSGKSLKWLDGLPI
jgi:Ran GTPase-activating protein (RanGAP) involved in mRNA processing and transport